MATRTLTYGKAICEAMREEMLRDESVFLMGEDVGIYGGAYHASEGLWEEFGDERVRDTPISELAIVGVANGAAMTGMRPIAEIMYIDFSTLASDQIINISAKNRFMFGGKTKVPIVIRTEGGTGRGIAGHHSQSLEALYVHIPGLYTVMPSTPYDAKGLLKSAIRNDNPVMFIEHKALYGTKGEVPEEDYVIPLGVGEVKREGTDVTIVAYSKMVLHALEAAEELRSEGISCEVIDPRTLKPLDMELIARSVAKTNRAAVVSEACKTNGFGGELAASIGEECFDDLDAPVLRICGLDTPIPMSPVLESYAVPGTARIVADVKSHFFGR